MYGNNNIPSLLAGAPWKWNYNTSDCIKCVARIRENW